MEYAIVDIETTGGHASGSGITEIAIRIHDGVSVIDAYETLIDPQRGIPISIQSLTGITDDMLWGSPTFDKVAHQIYDLLQGRIFVAHNVNFDYSFVRHHLEKAGYAFKAPKLCTVRLSRKIKPGFRSYSLGNLCTDLDIPIINRHRAGGDADATAILFSRLMEWDTEGHIPAMLKRTSKDQALPPNLPAEQFEALPQVAGVYYFKDQVGKVIYVGKATNIRKRVASHFSGNNPNPQRQNFLREIYSIDFEKCGTELMALLLEATEIKRIWPKYNRALKKFEPKFGLYSYEDRNGFTRLDIGPITKSQMALHEFNTYTEARDMLHQLAVNFGLCAAMCKLGDCSGDCHNPQLLETDNNQCLTLVSADDYNELVSTALKHFNKNLPSFMLLDKGRDAEEKSCVWIENGMFYGMGYIHQFSDIHSLTEVKDVLTRYKSNYYMMQLVHSYARKYPSKVIPVKPIEAVEQSIEHDERQNKIDLY